LPGYTTRQAKPGETIVIYGIGFGTVTPDIPAGRIVTQTNQLMAPILMLFGQTAASLAYAGLAPGFVGLYQFNLTVPAIADSDAVPFSFTLGGVGGTQTPYTAVHQ